MKRKRRMYLRLFPALTGIAVCIAGLLIYPRYTSQGIRNGLTLLGENLIPSLFPFMVLSTYISQSPVTELASRLLNKPARKIWNINGNGLIAVILGLIGGYPVGAKTVAEFCEDGKISKNDAAKLMNWCVNPGPAFVITAVGTFMLNNTGSGIILYVSSILSTLCIGFFLRFWSNAPTDTDRATEEKERGGNLLIRSVASGSEGMLSMCGWVLTFSAVAGLCDALISTEGLRLFIQAVAEVTTGCKISAGLSLPLPGISAVIGFGGFAVIAQVSPYLEKCGARIKQFICWRTVNAALNAFFCSQIVKFFPRSDTVFAPSAISSTNATFSHSVSAAVILLLMCLVLIFEVDNRRKIC